MICFIHSLQVQLKKGETDLDFKNYGLEIKVKFHDKDKLQALSSSIQSGGEKSVTTALYMMALQDMTQVHKRDITECASGSPYSYTWDSNPDHKKIFVKKNSKNVFSLLLVRIFFVHENLKHRVQNLLIIIFFPYSPMLPIWPKIENPCWKGTEALSVISTLSPGPFQMRG